MIMYLAFRISIVKAFDKYLPHLGGDIFYCILTKLTVIERLTKYPLKTHYTYYL